MDDSALLPKSRLLRVADVASHLSMSRSAIYDLMDRGSLVYVKIGKSRRVPLESVEKLVRENTIGAEKPHPAASAPSSKPRPQKTPPDEAPRPNTTTEAKAAAKANQDSSATRLRPDSHLHVATAERQGVDPIRPRSSRERK